MVKFISYVAMLMAFPVTTATPVLAQQASDAALVGSWRLTAVYDQFTDGRRRRDTWGDHPQGYLLFTANGLVSAAVMSGDRLPKAGSVPSDPAGPAIAYYGTYKVDASGKKFTVHVQQSTWPQWNGAMLDRTVVELSTNTLKVVAAPIRDPQAGEFQPHLEFERIP